MAQYNISVKLVEPGVVITPILTKAAGDAGQGAERRPVDRQSPYIDLIKYVNRWYAAASALQQVPSMAADVIATASRDKSPRLRFAAGQDARAFFAARSEVTDEIWAEQVSVVGVKMPFFSNSLPSC